MTSPIKKVALCFPTGKVGPIFLKALQTEGFDVTVIARASSKSTYAFGLKVTRVADDFPKDELVTAFKAVDAVVLALPFPLLGEADKFAQASLAAGNKWLIASTYGSNLDDPKFALFPASVPHRQAVDELIRLQKGQDTWGWTSISCGPWPELAIAAGAWRIDPHKKTAEVVEGGEHVFTTSTREQLGRAVARILKKQPASAGNKSVFISSFEVTMQTWIDAHKQILGSDGWKVNSVGTEAIIEQSQAALAAGDFNNGYTGLALAVCTGPGFQNQFSKAGTLLNEELDLPKENLLATVKEGLSLPNPFA